MIKKYSDLRVDIKLLDGLVILAVLLFSLALNVYSFPFGIVGLVLFNLFQVVFAFVLAVELEEIYFNHKKAHMWILVLVVFGVLLLVVLSLSGSLVLLIVLVLLTINP